MDILEQIKSHVEFLGYDVTVEEERGRAKHPERWNIVYREFKGGILFQTYFGVSDYGKSNKEEFFNFLNLMNQGAVVVRFYADDDFDLVMEAWLPSGYEKQTFGRFVEQWDNDTRTRLPLQEAEKFLS